VETICPKCNTRVAVRLKPGQPCPACFSTEAWETFASRGLVIDRTAIEESELKRAGESRGAGALARLRPYLPTAVAVAAAVAAAPLTFLLLRAVPVGPLAALRSRIFRLAAWATAAGFVAFAVAVTALILQLRGRLFRSVPLLAGNALAVCVGVAASFLGGSHLYLTGRMFGWQHDTMPAIEVVATPLVRTAMDATAVVLAPDGDGDMRGVGIGTGAVIGRSAQRTWILTNSHVAIPYLPTGASRDPARAHPVWVYLSDGRSGEGKVRWAGQPPLDVVLVSTELGGAPQQVAIAPDAGGVGVGAEVFFVPNPLRGGWMSHPGTVVQRDPHDTPAGSFGLLLTNLPLQPGDSGSGLFDATGRLVGINTWAMLTLDGKPAAVPRGISLPSDVLHEIMNLIESESLDSLEKKR
jgi:S1-C subfamily serine protease